MENITIIGSGSMGSGIAQVAAGAGCRVCLYDKDPEALTRARGKLRRIAERLVEKGEITEAASRELLGRIYFSENLYDCSGADLVIEAVVEDLDVKQHLFRQVEEMLEGGGLLATNTSSLSVSAIASACRKPEKVIGTHFFNPAPLMQLVEIIPAAQTAAAVVDRVRQLIDGWGKTTVLAGDTPGFIVNRVARPFYGEALRILDEGLADAPTVDWAVTELGGFPMGPFALMDYIGNDVNYKVTETIFEAFYYDPRYKPSHSQKRLVEAGYLGRKSGRGFYRYGEGAPNAEPDKDAALGESILERILAMLINEAADALYLGIASRDDIELAMTRGVNYPRGLLRWADEIGIARCVGSMDRLHDEYREDRYRCSPLLRRMARERATFFEG